MRSSPDFFVRVVRLILRIFFRRLEVVGAERLPLGNPMVLVANHVNSLVDPLLLMGSLPVRPRTLAASFLWDNPLVRPWMSWAGAIPVYRQQDRVDTAQNEETFRRWHKCCPREERSPCSRRGRATASRPCSRSRPAWPASSWEPSAATRGPGRGSSPWA